MKRRLSGRSEVLSALLLASIPLAFLTAVGLFQLLHNVPEAKSARDETLRRFSMIRLANAFDEAIQDAERGQRGFLITGREIYLDPYARTKARLPEILAELKRDATDDVDQQRRVSALEADATAKMDELAATIATRRSEGFEAAKAIVDTDAGRRRMHAIQADLAAIEDAAESGLQQGLMRSESAEHSFTQTFIAGSAVASLSLLAAAFMLAQAYRSAALSERILRATLDNVREGVATFDENDYLLAWNETFVRFIALCKHVLRRGAPLPVDDTESPAANKLLNAIAQIRKQVRQTGRPALLECDGADEKLLEIFNSSAPGGYVTTLLDITERRRTEEALRQAQKFEALGQMTGGLAHDFNNLLTVVIGNLGMLRGAVAGNAKATERIEMANLAAERGARLTKQLLAFARRQPLQPEIVNLSRLLTETMPLIRRAVGEAIQVEFVSAGSPWNAKVDPVQFQSAVLNLAINARDAMREGGKLTIEALNASLDEIYASHCGDVEPGQYVLLAVTDTGHGMDAATMARAFEPFFTTKPVGVGSGLGLPQVYGFVKQSGGHLRLYSEVGKGTTVKLYLPRTLDPEPTPLRAAPVARSGAETVLLVDDDEIVRVTVASMLESLGYCVVSASNGTQALAELEQNGEINLLFTDVVMPGPVGGRILAERASAMRPGLKILFTSGFTENAIIHNGQLDPGVKLLSKPYDRDQLAAKIRHVLDS